MLFLIFPFFLHFNSLEFSFSSFNIHIYISLYHSQAMFIYISNHRYVVVQLFELLGSVFWAK